MRNRRNAKGRKLQEQLGWEFCFAVAFFGARGDFSDAEVRHRLLKLPLLVRQKKVHGF
jgi:hypothetical protein